MKVGGRDFLLTKGEVEWKMRGVAPEIVQKYAVSVNGEVFPPKQVLGQVTGWERTSFTTMEAQRVLSKIGFKSYVAGSVDAVPPSTPSDDATQTETGGPDRLRAVELALMTAQEAIAGLAARVRALEQA